MLSALSEVGAEFLIVGAHALSAHGYPWTTRDLDVWILPEEEKAQQVWRAIERL
jgi:hypothetical protein